MKPANSKNKFKTVYNRIERLPLGVRGFISNCGVMPDLTARKYRQKAAIAKSLVDAAGGEIGVFFTGNCHDDDGDGYGHIFYADLLHSEVSHMYLDDRQPDMRGQLAAELRRVAGEYLRLAELCSEQGSKELANLVSSPADADDPDIDLVDFLDSMND